MTITYGDSRETVPKTAGEKVYDLIHVDGGHDEDVVRSDLKNIRRLCGDHTIIISDDDDMPSVHTVNREYLDRIDGNQWQYIGVFRTT